MGFAGFIWAGRVGKQKNILVRGGKRGTRTFSVAVNVPFLGLPRGRRVNSNRGFFVIRAILSAHNAIEAGGSKPHDGF